MKNYQKISVLLLMLSMALSISCNKVKTPTVNTSSVNEVTATTVVASGVVITDGGAEVNERGICWSMKDEPTLAEDHVASGAGVGSYSCLLSGLKPETTYYIRAYAFNEAGVGYGESAEVTTLASDGGGNEPEPDPEPENLLAVTTLEVINIEATSATSGGVVTVSGTAQAFERGVCWSREPEPDIMGSHVSSGSGVGSFSCEMTGLTAGMTYYVRAYVFNAEGGVTYGNELSFVTLSWSNGMLPGRFSVSSTEKVVFSQGNLQFQASTSTWRFAEKQWDYVGTVGPEYGETGGTVPGSDNNHIASDYNGWIDLYSWGTSGYNHGAQCYQPWSISDNASDYFPYGSQTANLNDETGMADWGYNAISNGGNTIHCWHTPTRQEWYYILNTRSTPSGIRFVKAMVNEVKGLILLPDDWNVSICLLSNPNDVAADFSSNSITASQWSDLERNGAVFLPAAGNRLKDETNNPGSLGMYWSTTKSGFRSAWTVYFNNYSMSLIDLYSVSNAYAVRLVRSAL